MSLELPKLPSLSQDPHGVKAQKIMYEFFVGPERSGLATPDNLLPLLDWMARTATALTEKAEGRTSVSSKTKRDIKNFRNRVAFYRGEVQKNKGGPASSTAATVGAPVLLGNYEAVPDGADGFKLPGIPNGTKTTTSDIGTAYRLSSELDMDREVFDSNLEQLQDDLVDSALSLPSRAADRIASGAKGLAAIPFKWGAAAAIGGAVVLGAVALIASSSGKKKKRSRG